MTFVWKMRKMFYFKIATDFLIFSFQIRVQVNAMISLVLVTDRVSMVIANVIKISKAQLAMFQHVHKIANPMVYVEEFATKILKDVIVLKVGRENPVLRYVKNKDPLFEIFTYLILKLAEEFLNVRLSSNLWAGCINKLPKILRSMAINIELFSMIIRPLKRTSINHVDS